MIEVLKQAKKIYDDYKTPDSQIDEGNLYWALGALLAELEKQEPVAKIFMKNGYWIETSFANVEHLKDGVHELYTSPQTLRQEQDGKCKPVAFITNKRQRLTIELTPEAFTWQSTVIDWEVPLYTSAQKAGDKP
jgi:hypothetical protein